MAKVVITAQAQNDFKKIQERDKKKIRKRLGYLEKNTYVGKKLTGKLSESYSLRAWPYRIFYIVHKNKVWITHIEHRQGAYKK